MYVFFKCLSDGGEIRSGSHASDFDSQASSGDAVMETAQQEAGLGLNI